MCCDLATGINGGVDAGVDVIADDRAELSPSGIDKTAIDHRAVVRAIVAEIRSDRARAKIDFVTDDRIADVGKMADGGVIENEGILDLHGLADVAVVADAGGTADVTIGSDFAVSADHDISLDEDSRKDA